LTREPVVHFWIPDFAGMTLSLARRPGEGREPGKALLKQKAPKRIMPEQGNEGGIVESFTVRWSSIASLSWIPACAGMTGKGVYQQPFKGLKRIPLMPDRAIRGS